MPDKGHDSSSFVVFAEPQNDSFLRAGEAAGIPPTACRLALASLRRRGIVLAGTTALLLGPGAPGAAAQRQEGGGKAPPELTRSFPLGERELCCPEGKSSQPASATGPRTGADRGQGEGGGGGVPLAAVAGGVGGSALLLGIVGAAVAARRRRDGQGDSEPETPVSTESTAVAASVATTPESPAVTERNGASSRARAGDSPSSGAAEPAAAPLDEQPVAEPGGDAGSNGNGRLDVGPDEATPPPAPVAPSVAASAPPPPEPAPAPPAEAPDPFVATGSTRTRSRRRRRRAAAARAAGHELLSAGRGSSTPPADDDEAAAQAPTEVPASEPPPAPASVARTEDDVGVAHAAPDAQAAPDARPDDEGAEEFAHGVRRQHAGDLRSAEEHYRRAEAAGNRFASFNLALLLHRRGDEQGAEEAYLRAHQRGDRDAMFNLGVLLYERGDLDGAEYAWRQSDVDGRPEVAANLGHLLEQQGRLDEAADAYRRAAAAGDRTSAERLALLPR